MLGVAGRKGHVNQIKVEPQSKKGRRVEVVRGPVGERGKRVRDTKNYILYRNRNILEKYL
jgi:hypothetical protein